MRKTISHQIQQGLTIVELLVAMTINMFIIGAAVLLYQNSSRVNAQIEQQTIQQETASLVIDMIARDILNSGFWPAVYPPPQSVAAGLAAGTATVSLSYVPPEGVTPVPASMETPVFACDGNSFDQSNGVRTCQTGGGANDPDTLILNSYNADTFAAPLGPVDCLRQTVIPTAAAGTVEPLNFTARPAVAGDPPQRPYFVQNVYSVGPAQNVTLNGAVVQSRSFRCSGNGNLNNPQPLFAGVEDFQVWFGIFDGTPDAPSPLTGRTATRYLNATQMAIEPSSPWQRVVALRVCVLTKTFSANVTSTGAPVRYTNCQGVQVTPAANDRAVYSATTRTLRIRHGQSNVYMF